MHFSTLSAALRLTRNLRACQDWQTCPEIHIADETGVLVLLGRATASAAAGFIPFGPRPRRKHHCPQRTQTAARAFAGILGVGGRYGRINFTQQAGMFAGMPGVGFDEYAVVWA